jgi:DNA replication protein DnaC
MLIDFTCETHGTNKLKLSDFEERSYNSRKDFPHALEEYIKNDLKCAVCSKNEQIESLKNLSSIPLRFKSCSFDTFNNTKEKNIVLDYVKNFKEKQALGTSLVFCGTTGTGKTHLCSALTSYLIENYQIKILYTKAFDLLRDVKETYNRNSKYSFADVHHKHAKVDLLIIDEIGVQFGTDTEKQILFEIINDRYENLKPTILVTNLSLTNLKEFAGDRVIDRMKENGGKIVIFSGESFRGKK